MLYALSNKGEKVLATPGSRAYCPACGSVVIAKCGSKIARHWAHKHGSDCDRWSEETEWHLAWKDIIRESRCEVIIEHGGKIHRADIIGNKNTIIELQHAPISAGEIRERERFYGNMIWVFDASGFFGNVVFTLKGDYVAMTWYYSRAAICSARKPVYFHLPCGNIFKLEHVYPRLQDKPLRGWGRFIGWRPFFHRYLSSVVKAGYSNGEAPRDIMDRANALSKLKFHHSLKIAIRCECDAKAEFPNCRYVFKYAEEDHIRRLLGTKRNSAAGQ